MKPRSLSPVAVVNVTSNVILSSVGADGVRHHRGGLGEHLAFAAHVLGQAGGVGILRKSHRRLCSRRFVGRAVHRLGDADLVDPFAGTAEHHPHHVGHPGMCPAAEDSGIALLAGLSDAFDILG